MSLKTIVLLLALVSIASCSKPPEPAFKDSSQADAALRKLCQEEFQYDVVTNAVGKTLWVYLPLTKPVFEFALKEKPAPIPDEPPEQDSAADQKPAWTILTFDARFAGQTFLIEYDILPASKPSRARHESVSPNITENFTQAENRMLTTLSRTHFDIKDPKTSPDFVVLVIADVTQGLAVKETFSLTDLKKVFVEALPQEEFVKRFLQESFGLKSLVGDKQGSSLDYQEVRWPDFLSEQMINRVYFKFQQSDFPPSGDAADEVLALAAQTLNDYQFEDFKDLKLTDLRTKKEYLFQREQLQTFLK